MKGLYRKGICGLILAMLLTGGCEADGGPAGTTDTSGEGKGHSAIPAATVQPATAVPVNAVTANPADMKSFLKKEKIPHGDLFLEDSLVHVNIVGLSPSVAEKFARRFTKGSYILHDVKYTAQELDAAHTLLIDKDLHRSLNLYSSWIDVKRNKIGITLPDDQAAAAIQALESVIAPDMLFYDIDELGEAHVSGTIVEIERNPVVRVLVLEPGHTDPTYWFSFNEYSLLSDSKGKTIGVSDLKKGQGIRLWSTGMQLDSLPAQATVRKLELES